MPILYAVPIEMRPNVLTEAVQTAQALKLLADAFPAREDFRCIDCYAMWDVACACRRDPALCCQCCPHLDCYLTFQ